jgi:hypothetical protein
VSFKQIQMNNQKKRLFLSKFSLWIVLFSFIFSGSQHVFGFSNRTLITEKSKVERSFSKSYACLPMLSETSEIEQDSEIEENENEETETLFDSDCFQNKKIEVVVEYKNDNEYISIFSSHKLPLYLLFKKLKVNLL